MQLARRIVVDDLIESKPKKRQARRTPDDQLRRVRRGVALFHQGLIKATGANHWKAISATHPNRSYNVTLESCDCPDIDPHCKHLYAGPGLYAALLICAMMDAQTIAVLEFIASSGFITLNAAKTPEHFVKIAESFQRLREIEINAL